MSVGQNISLIGRAEGHGARPAIVATEGTFTYRQLLEASARVASGLLGGAKDLNEARVAYLVPPGFEHVAVLWGIWRAGGIAVPLCVTHPPPEWDYVLEDAGAVTVVTRPELAAMCGPLAQTRGCRFVLAQELLQSQAASLPPVPPSRRASILYTSGTTGRPKGVVLTHQQIQAQITTLVFAWEWTAEDRTLLVLPLHHVHGLINVLACALWAGATCEIMPRFEAEAVWERFLLGHLTLFMAVPTIYVKLIAAWESAPPERRKAMSDACARMRLMVSGSAALPVATLEKWKAISGHVLLERYGMTEIGMALSNPLHGRRAPGYVGTPLPGVEVRLVDEQGQPVPPGTPGEIQVRGPGVFLEYWRRPEATAQAFRQGWFCTGDIAVVEDGLYRILGRSSVDIVKTGGYKVSAIEVEEVLRTHPYVKDCAVVGVPDTEWGERVSAALVLKAGRQLTLASLRRWAQERLATYKVPTRILLLDELPRNAVGKVLKPEVRRLFEASS